MIRKISSIKLLLSLLSFIIIILSTSPVLALGLKDGFQESSDSNLFKFAIKSYTPSETPEFYIGMIITAFFSILGIIAIALIIYSGVTWMTARGNESKVEKAKGTLIEVTIGLIFIIGGYALKTFLLNIFAK